MRVDDGVRKTVVFLGHESVHGFTPYGTAFFTGSEVEGATFQSLVTAKHVVASIPGDTVFARINLKRGGCRTLPLPKEDWHYHPNPELDIAVVPTVFNLDRFDILHLPIVGPSVLSAETVEQFDIGAGDEVFIAGLYTPAPGATRNIPIVRVGTIAAMAEEEFRTSRGYCSAHLIEARSIDGLSGSPVHVNRAPVQRDRISGNMKFQHGHMALLMGMLLGHSEVRNPSDVLEIGAESTLERTDKGVAWNTGIGVVIPIERVAEAVNQPWIVKQRLAALRAGY